MTTMVQRAVVGLTLFLSVLIGKLMLFKKPRQKYTTSTRRCSSLLSLSLSSSSSSSDEKEELEDDDEKYGVTWRMAVEANNVTPWRTVPARCHRHVQRYMTEGQYQQDLHVITQQILCYAQQIPLATGDGFDAWVLDVDDTCISNLSYYKANRFGCEAFDSVKFKEWIMKGECPAIPAVLTMFNMLVEGGFKVFLLTGRDQATLSQITIRNLHNQGFTSYHRLILRSGEYKGQSAVKYKSSIRKKIEEEGYRIWGNVGDQWSDLQGFSLGKRTFKLPNPMYFIP